MPSRTCTTQQSEQEKCRRGARAFVRPRYTLEEPETNDPGDLAALPDLVDFNAAYNPDHIFCLQYHRDTDEPPVKVTFKKLHEAVLRCSMWLQNCGHTGVALGETNEPKPVALFLGSDVSWWIIFLALLRLGVPVLSLSARLSTEAVLHLLDKTATNVVISSSQVQDTVDDAIAVLSQAKTSLDKPVFLSAPPYTEFLGEHSAIGVHNVPTVSRFFEKTTAKAVILHSSGTTGLPKPIYQSHAYLLGFAACHRLSPEDVEGALNVSTLPLYHGFGLLAPCLALSIGMPFALPAATAIPTGISVLSLLRSARATSLMTVPSILEELYLQPEAAGTQALKALRFVAVGGAAMKHTVAEPLATAGVPLLNHCGVTEIGGIAPIETPTKMHDWRYLRLRDDIPLRIEPIDGAEAGQCRLVGCPPGSRDEFVVQDLLEVNPKAPDIEFRIAGRVDDLIVLATGEKVRPTRLETGLGEDPLVKAAIAFGDGRFQMGIIVETATHVALDPSDEHAVAAYVAQIWPTIERANVAADAHAEVTRDMIVVTTPHTRPLVRTPKGSIPRGPNVEMFKSDIAARYERVRDAGIAPSAGLPLDRDGIQRVVCAEVRAAWGRAGLVLGDDDDFFERGMNSLQATVLRKRLGLLLNAELRTTLPADLVYGNSTIGKLTSALCALREGIAVAEPHGDRVQRLEALLAEYTCRLASREVQKPKRVCNGSEGMRILLIGSTGSLGGAILSALVASAKVDVVYALNRRSQISLRERQENALRDLGVEMKEGWKKVVLLESDLAKERFGLGEQEYDDLRFVTHILHNAWPMNFNHKVEAFRQAFELVLNVVELANACTAGQPTRVLFSSSIAVVGRHSIIHGATEPVPEVPQASPDVTEYIGYAEAKWVCERLYEIASTKFPNRISATNIRMGQLTGCTGTAAWNTDEHLPMIVKSCLAVGKIPLLSGDASWIPVDKAGDVIAEMVLAKAPLPHVLHLENHQRRSWRDIMQVVAADIDIIDKDHMPFPEWLKLVKTLPDPVVNPAAKLIAFLEHSFIRLATGDIVLDTTIAQSISATLRTVDGISDELILRYLQYWKRTEFLV